MTWISRLSAAFAVALMAMGGPALAQGRSERADLVTVSEGALQGAGRGPDGVRRFLGVPFAAPPVGDLRWKAPQPARPWSGVRPAAGFGNRCMQAELAYPDLVTRAPALSEDCLYLNVWTPAKAAGEKLPVLVYLYGGGLTAGDASEPRYDGASMAARGMVVVTLNYRLGVFGFLATPELSKETGWGGSGDWGLLDQAAGLAWVRRNIAAFGGDPGHITIGGESAGSISVSALMASPLSRDLIVGAIGESGSIMGALDAVPMTEAEAAGTRFMAGLGAGDLSALRTIPADRLYAAARTAPRFAPTVDGRMLPKPVARIYEAGEQAHAPLLAGSNSQENPALVVLGGAPPTVENYRKALARLYADQADAAFAAYPASADGEPVLDAAQALASDRFIAFSTWRWVDAASRTGGRPAYYFYYSRPRPPLVPGQVKDMPDPSPAQTMGAARGAVHSAEIEYALGNLGGRPLHAWTAEDRAVSSTMQSYFANFIKTGDPNGAGLPRWTTYAEGGRMQIDVTSTLRDNAPDKARYRFMAERYDAGLK